MQYYLHIQMIRIVALCCIALLIVNCAGFTIPDDGIVNIYVTKQGRPAPTSSASEPYHMIESASARAKILHEHDDQQDLSVLIGPGKYYETLTINTPVMLKASSGLVTIGKLDYKASTTLEVITLNTHLFGDHIGPSWQDCERAGDIVDFIKARGSKPDVIVFQEIWDEDYFTGGDCDGEVEILSDTGYRYGIHTFALPPPLQDSGLAIMTKKPMIGFHKQSFAESALADRLAGKGWTQATIEKDGFSIGVFNTHTQAGNRFHNLTELSETQREELEDPDDCGLEDIFSERCSAPAGIQARLSQIRQLAIAVLLYRATHPSHAVLVMGDFNIYGEAWEYNERLIPWFGFVAGGKDADRNSPGFVVGGTRESWLEEQRTLCDCNRLATYFDNETISGRLDYIFYFPSLDPSVEILPTSINVLQFRGDYHSEDGRTMNESSDHWGIIGQFKLLRIR